MNMRTILLAAVTLMAFEDCRAAEVKAHSLLTSPNGRIDVALSVDVRGQPHYEVRLDRKSVLLPSRLGLVREDADFSNALELVKESPVERVIDDYEMLTSKRRLNHYVANRRVVELKAASGEPLELIFQVSDDGVAFRYRFPRTSTKLHKLTSEASSFRFLPGAQAWLQPMSAAKTGYKGVNPAYEEIYEQDAALGTPSPTGAGWVYPALFRSGDVWMLVSEGSLPRNYCGTRLRSSWLSTEYTVSFPDPLERMGNGPVKPESTLPWLTPWRFIAIGTLKTLVESTLGTDLADKPQSNATAPPNGPGKASWSWPLLGDDQTTFQVQKRFVDYAAEMGWQYTLVDGLWDQQIGYDKLAELVTYAKTKGVRILVWYNSAGDWNLTPQTPRNLMLTHESRLREFERLKAIGVAGLKIDFFGGDGQSVIAYYHDILEDAAPYGFVMNFHGATLPRGWQRTYPFLMTTEAVRGLEFVTFSQKNAEDEPTHAAMLPFTRNVFDPMDFTPMVLDHIKGVDRRTSSAFELALSVLFTSGVQHYAETPDGMARTPDYVREFLRHVPSIWDDVQFIDGFPGKYVVIARRGNGRWFVAGINAERSEKTLELPLTQLGVAGGGTLITDGDGPNLSFRNERVQLGAGQKLSVKLRARGGFVIAFD
jgi:hypothetical protein